MKKIFILVITIFLASAVITDQTGQAKAKFLKSKLPKRHVELKGASPENPIISLGKAKDKKTSETVEGVAIVHYAKNYGKALKPNAKRICYALLAQGAKWKTLEPWLADPQNASDLKASFILNNISSDISKWENAAKYNILGDGSLSQETLFPDETAPDAKNEVLFADIDSPNAIAVTIVWGIFSGPASKRKLVEWDQVYDDVDFDWSSSGEAGKMDFENIATHELGHSMGMGDLYNSYCSEQTMYGYANYGETKKRTLESGDITGINVLY